LKTFLIKYITEIQSIAKKGFFHLFAVTGFIYIIGFVSQLFVAGFLDPVDIGRIKIMQTYIGLAAILSGFGFNTALLKLASENRSEEEKADLLHLSMFLAIILFILIYLVLLILSKTGLISTDPIITRIFPYYALFLLPLVVQSMQLAYYQAIKELKKMAIIQFYVKLISLVLILTSTYLFKLKGYVVIISVTGFLSVFSLKKGLHGFAIKFVKLQFKFKYVVTMWKLAKYALIANLVGTLLYTADIYLINYLIADRTEIGYYMFALTIISAYQIIITSIQQVAFPFFSNKSDNPVDWLKSYEKYNKLNYYLLIIVCLAGIIIIPPFIKLVFSNKYNASLIYFVFLSIAWMIHYLNMMKGTALMGYGRFDINFYISLIGLVICFPVMYFLIKLFGLKGAIIGRIFEGVIIYLSSYTLFHSFVKKINA
jgi:O-antigen/teichoic acid export membrane protein